MSSPQTHSWAFLPLSAVQRQSSISALLRHLLSSTACFGQLFALLEKLAFSSSSWFHTSTRQIWDGAGQGSFPSKPLALWDLPLPSGSHKDLWQAWLYLGGSPGLNPDCPLSFFYFRAVFCRSALENRLLEGSTPGQESPCQTLPPARNPPGDFLRQCPQCTWDKGQQQHISSRKLGWCLAQLNGGNFSSSFYFCIYLTLLKFSCSSLPLLSAWPPPGQAPALPQDNFCVKGVTFCTHLAGVTEWAKSPLTFTHKNCHLNKHGAM